MLSTANKIFVTGANGNQGSATARGDLDNANSYRNQLHDCNGVFCLLTYIHGVNKEIKQGFDLVNAAKENGTKHFVYSSVIGSDLDTGIPHWESKNKIEDHIKASGMSYTILRPSSLYENMLIPQVKSRILKGKLVLPTRRETVQQFISSEDVGKIAATVFSDPGKYDGLTMNLAAEQMNGDQLAAIFSKAMGREIKFQQLPMLITRLVMGRDLAKMFRWVNNNDACFVKDIQSFRDQFPVMLSLEEWIKIHFKTNPQ